MASGRRKKKKKAKKNHSYAKGRRFEYKAIAVLKEMGFQIIFRSPKSGGIFDIFALKAKPGTRKVNEARYIQVKASRSPFSLKSVVSKKERDRIIKNKTVVMLGRKTFYEIWVRRLNKKWDIYRLNWDSQEFEMLS